MNKQEIIEQVREVVAQVNRKYYPNFLAMPDVEFFDKGTICGRAFYTAHKVKFNIVIAHRVGLAFRNTIKHEIAHLVTKKLHPHAKAHGPEFKRIFIDLGGSGTTRSRYVTECGLDVSDLKQKYTKRRFIYSCPCGTPHRVSMVKHHRLQKTPDAYHCAICKKPMTFTGEVVEKVNK